MVVNLSGEMLDDRVTSLLQKGLNYAVTPHTIPIDDIWTGVEDAISTCRDCGKEPGKRPWEL